MGLFDTVKAWASRASQEMLYQIAPSAVAPSMGSPVIVNRYTGEKFQGGMGPVQLLHLDYWELRQRSAQLFRTNLYARGIIRRLVTNVINTGLILESTPDENTLGLESGALADWTDDVENRFRLWAKDPSTCDYFEQQTFGALQAAVFMEAMISGDVLVVLRTDPRSRLPKVQLIPGEAIQTPLNRKPRKGHEIIHGVEHDPQGRQVAYWVAQGLGSFRRLPAVGERSGRRIAWLVYGGDKRLDDVRGEPILSIVSQSLQEIDKYRDSASRKALLNSYLALFIKKTEAKPGSGSMTMGGPIRKGHDTTITSDGEERRFNVGEFMPGMILDQLQVGEEPQGFSPQGTDEKFSEFEAAITNAISWQLEIPPEILKQQFSHNYSASQAAINEFKAFLDRARMRFGEAFCVPVYQEWLLSQVLLRKINATGLLDAWRDPAMLDTFGAWVQSDWTGHIKPSTDTLKQARGFREMIEMGLITRDRATKELIGAKYSTVIKQLGRENQQLREALEPLAGLEEGGGTESLENEEGEESRQNVAS